MTLLLSELHDAIRAETDHDSDTQVTNAQLTERANIDYQNLRRKLIGVAPQIYAVEDDSQTLVTGDSALDMPADFERLVRLEKQVGSSDMWIPVEVSTELDPHYGCLAVREEDGVLKLAPTSLTAGTWRIVYVPKPDGLVDDDQDIILPDGLEDILIQQGAAFVRRRMDEDPSPHLQQADMVWKEQRSALRRRYGRHAQPGLRLVRRW